MIKNIAAILLFTAALLASDPPREQKLQQAIDLVESKGDLAHAIPLLEDVARSSDRALAARGLLYLGQAQERQDAGRARATYERIIKDFSSQTDMVAEAHKRLAALDGTGSHALTARRVDVGEIPNWISADGRWMAIASSGDIAIRDMTNGQVKRLLANASGQGNCPVASHPVLSPDLRQVAYLCYGDGTPDNTSRSLRVMANEVGAKSRVLVHNREFLYVYPTAWSPDGKAILAQMWKFDNTAQLAWVSVASGSVTLLTSLEWRQPDRPSLSPDGRYIAYSALVRADSTERHVYILAADGSGETELEKTGGVNEAPTWTPDGGHIIFSSDRSGSNGVWSIAVRNGKPEGAASLVKADIGKISAIGITRSGSYYYIHARGGEDVFVADFRDGKFHGASRVSEKFVGSNRSAVWSPDGKLIAFKRQRPGQAEWVRGYDLVVQSLESGEEKTYPNNLTTGAPQRLFWFHDSKAILLAMADNQNRVSYHLLDLKTALWKEIVPDGGMHAALSPDDKTLYIAVGGRSQVPGIVAIDLANGQRRPVVFFPDGLAGLALSPDGRRLALVTAGISGNKSRLLVVGTDAGPDVMESTKAELQSVFPEQVAKFATILGPDPLPRMMGRFPGYRELYAPNRVDGGFDGSGMTRALAFTKDGREVLFGFHPAKEPGVLQLMRVPVEGGKPDSTGLAIHDGKGHNIDLSPDGSRIAFSDGDITVSELWALDNLLPLLKAAK